MIYTLWKVRYSKGNNSYIYITQHHYIRAIYNFLARKKHYDVGTLSVYRVECSIRVSVGCTSISRRVGDGIVDIYIYIVHLIITLPSPRPFFIPKQEGGGYIKGSFCFPLTIRFILHSLACYTYLALVHKVPLFFFYLSLFLPTRPNDKRNEGNRKLIID